MFQAQNRETVSTTWKVDVFQDHYEDKHDKTVINNTTSDLQDQNQSNKTKTDFFLSQTGLVLRPTVSDHLTVGQTPFLATSMGDSSRGVTTAPTDSTMRGWQRVKWTLCRWEKDTAALALPQQTNFTKDVAVNHRTTAAPSIVIMHWIKWLNVRASFITKW